MKGERKLIEARQTALFLLAGLVVAGLFKMEAELYLAFALGMAGKTGAFMWGNAKEHQAQTPSA